MSNEIFSDDNTEISPTEVAPLPTVTANLLRDHRNDQIKVALLSKILEELDAGGLTVADLALYVKEGHATNDTQRQVELHRARRHNLNTHQETLKKAQEARKSARKLKG